MQNKRKLTLSLAIIFAINIMIISCIQGVQNADAAAYRKGSAGSIVTQIQRKLSDWGYYFGGVDGVYGIGTESAVKYFQRSNGLTADGVAGDATLAAIGIKTSAPATSIPSLARAAPYRPFLRRLSNASRKATALPVFTRTMARTP